MEIWDAYNQDFKKIPNIKLIRGTDIPDGMFHLVCEIIVRHINGEYLLMLRDPRKQFGNMWEATAGGSALQGETPLECAVRELKEETGIVSSNLTEVGQVISSEKHSIYVEFLCITDCDKDSIILQDGETSAYKWITKSDLINMKKDELVTKRILKFISDLQGEK